MAQFSKSKIQRSVERLFTLLGLAGAVATALPVQATQLPERLKLETRVAQARQVLRDAARAPAESGSAAKTAAEIAAGTLLAQANNWNNWPNWSNWANWANG